MLVDLSAFPDLGLIIEAPTGVRYTSQTAGFGCEHPEIEGFLVPLQTKTGRPELASLSGMFRGSWHALTEQDADALDALLKRHDFISIRVDRSLLSQSKEAWVHIVVSGSGEDGVPFSAGSTELLKGILTWPNSD